MSVKVSTEMLTDAARDTSEAERSSPLLRWAWFVPFVLAFAPTVLWLWQRWTISIWYNGHGIFMPFIVTYLVYEHLRNDPVSGAQSSTWGLAFLIPGLGMLALDAAIGTELLAATGLVVCLPGLSLLLLGAQRTRALAFPLLIAAFMLPIPAGFIADVHLFLRGITAWGVGHVVSAMGIPLAREGTLLLLPRTAVRVADACSGFSTLYASITTALILAHLVADRRRKLWLLAAAVPVAIVCNVVRVTGLTLMVQFWGTDLLDTSLHEGSGLLSFAVAVGALFWLAGREALRAPAAPPAPPAPPADGS